LPTHGDVRCIIGAPAFIIAAGPSGAHSASSVEGRLAAKGLSVSEAVAGPSWPMVGRAVGRAICCLVIKRFKSNCMTCLRYMTV
jgi:hypothetical protein